MGKQIIVNNKKELEREINKSKNKNSKQEEWKIYRAKKYGNVKVNKNANGIKTTFDSKAEYARYKELELLVSAGIITDLKIHQKFLLQNKFTNAKGEKIGAIHYIADFTYVKDGKMIVEDVKGFVTNDFKLKKKMFEMKYSELTIDIIKK